MRVRVGNGGWVAVDDIGLPGPLYLRVRPEPAGRLRVRELYLDTSTNQEASISGGDLRELPLAAIEAFLNTTTVADSVRRRQHYLAPDLATLASYYATVFGDYERQINQRDWVAISFADQLPPDEREGLPEFDHVPRKTRDWAGMQADRDFRLSSGPVGGLSDDFLRDVARAYNAALARGERPNVAIAEQTGYPRKSAQRWVYTARQRGIMPRGSRGRPG